VWTASERGLPIKGDGHDVEGPIIVAGDPLLMVRSTSISHGSGSLLIADVHSGVFHVQEQIQVSMKCLTICPQVMCYQHDMLNLVSGLGLFTTPNYLSSCLTQLLLFLNSFLP
jgi:hypothetical protein